MAIEKNMSNNQQSKEGAESKDLPFLFFVCVAQWKLKCMNYIWLLIIQHITAFNREKVRIHSPHLISVPLLFHSEVQT